MKRIEFGFLRRLVFFTFAIVLAVIPMVSANAATIAVGCDVPELVDAITAANASLEADTLELSAGCTYALTEVNNTSEARGPNGLPMITGDLTLSGNGATITRAVGAPRFRFFEIAGAAHLTMDQLTLEKGMLEPTTPEQSAYPGGAIYNLGTVDLTGCILRANWAHESGGGIFNDGGMVEVSESELEKNGVNWDVIATVHGGAIYSQQGTVRIVESEFHDNLASYDGGAVYSEGVLEVEETGFIKNITTLQQGVGGGAIFSSGTANITASTFDENETMLYGGALHVEGTATVSGSTFVGNAAWGGHGSGGGGAISGPADVMNSTFHENSAGFYANAAALEGVSSVVHGTFSNNHAERTDGTGIQGGVIKNSILYETTCSSVTDGGGNLYWPRSNSACPGIAGNPKLGPLADNGGLTETMALAPDSAAVNAAVDAECLPIDQRGVARPRGKHCDSGAFELEPPTAPGLILPPENKKFTHARVTLRWGAAERTTNYRVQVRRDARSGEQVVNEGVRETEYRTPALEAGHWYYWRVKACSNVDCIVSEWRRFRVK